MLISHVHRLGVLPRCCCWLDSLNFERVHIGVSCHNVTLLSLVSILHMFYLCCSFLPVTPCTRCFGRDSEGAYGAADLLEVLGKATTLEELRFDRCSQIPAAAWRRVPSGGWPKLEPKKAFGIPQEELQRVCAPSGGLRRGRGLQFVLIRADSSEVRLRRLCILG